MDRLAHRGPDGRDTRVRGPVALGHLHFWATPESVGERQPLFDPNAGVTIAFDGRLDNRGELLSAMDLGAPEDRRLSDAALVLRAYGRWGEACFERLLGPFAVVLYDAVRQRVIYARDPLGDRTLFYHLHPSVLVVASEEQAVLAHPAVSDELDEATLALYFAVTTPEDGATFFRDIRELLPAQAMAVDAGGVRTWRYWEFDGSRRLDCRSDGEYAEQYRALLAEAVRCRLRSATSPMVMMSGGLDSTSVAALAARQMAEAGHGGRLRSVSYVFDELTECDERPYMDTIIARYGIEALRFSGDNCWPLRDSETWPWNPNGPGRTPHRRLLDGVYATARGAGARVLLGGWFGDHHYTSVETWLADLLAERRWAEATREMSGHVRRLGLRRVLDSATVRHIGRRVLDATPAGRLRPRREAPPAAWLTPTAAGLIAARKRGPLIGTSGRRPEQVERMLGALSARAASSSASDGSGSGIEVWYPYRDRRLVEFMLSVPGHQLYNRGRYKYVLRNAMDGLLPGKIRLRIRPTSLMPLYARGLLDRESRTVRGLFDAGDAIWPRFVRPDWLAAAYPARIVAGIDGAETVVPWFCASFELWHRGLEGRSIAQVSWNATTKALSRVLDRDQRRMKDTCTA